MASLVGFVVVEGGEVVAPASSTPMSLGAMQLGCQLESHRSSGGKGNWSQAQAMVIHYVALHRGGHR